jgi:ATP-dependent protease ClpP protease subunit
MNWKPNRRSSSDTSDEPNIISMFGKPSGDDATDNKIYFYEEVSRESILNLNRQIDSVTKSVRNTQLTFNLPNPPAIELHICSEGGDVMSCMAAVDKIADSVVPIHTYVEGFAASAATLMSIVAAKRFITKSSTMLIHQVSSECWGTYANFKDEMKNLDMLMSLIRGVYLTRTKFKSKELEKLLSHDLFLTSNECLAKGLVDKIC